MIDRFPGVQIGYEHSFVHQEADFLQGLAAHHTTASTFRAGLATDSVTTAVLKSAKSGRWEGMCRLAEH
jgi:hypothetical protein